MSKPNSNIRPPAGPAPVVLRPHRVLGHDARTDYEDRGVIFQRCGGGVRVLRKRPGRY